MQVGSRARACILRQFFVQVLFYCSKMCFPASKQATQALLALVFEPFYHYCTVHFLLLRGCILIQKIKTKNQNYKCYTCPEQCAVLWSLHFFVMHENCNCLENNLGILCIFSVVALFYYLETKTIKRS